MKRSLLIVAALALPAHADVPPEPGADRGVGICHRIENPEVGRFVIVATRGWAREREPWRAMKPEGCLPLNVRGPTYVAAVDAAEWRERAGESGEFMLATDGEAVYGLEGGFTVPHDSDLDRRIVLYRVAGADEQSVVLYKYRVIDIYDDGRESVKEFPKP